MQPLHITAIIPGPIALAQGRLAFDALLAATIAVRDNIPPAMSVEELVPIEVPIQREPAGRFHLASFAIGQPVQHELRYVNRRFPIEQAQMFAESSVRVLRINAGPSKSYRIPLETMHLLHGRLDWWCVGDAVAIGVLLESITHLGKKRNVGLGKVGTWSVRPCEPWGDGFPVVRDSRALRTLPPDWPGLVEYDIRQARLTYPYWLRDGLESCAVPVI